MTTKELIRAKIEQLKHYAEESKMEWINDGYNQNAFAEDCRISSFDKLLTFIDSLPDEPVSDDLEEAAREIVIKMHPCMKDCTILGDRLTRGQLMALVKAGAEWQSKKEQDIIETAEDHAFLAGANWQKEQMMKDAVEGEVCILPGRAAYVKEKDNESLKQYLLDHFKYGDKVKIIIVKEEEQ